MKGELDYNQALDLTMGKGTKGIADFDRLQMLIDVYFPALLETFNRLLKVRGLMNKILSQHKTEYKQGLPDGSKFVEPMFDALDHIEKVGEQLKKEIIAQEKAV